LKALLKLRTPVTFRLSLRRGRVPGILLWVALTGGLSKGQSRMAAYPPFCVLLDGQIRRRNPIMDRRNCRCRLEEHNNQDPGLSRPGFSFMGDRMNETLACRGCRHPLTSDAGCALCLGVKAHLVVLGSTDDDNVSLAVVAQETVALLRKQLKHLKGKAKTGYNPEDAYEARAVANTLAKLLDSARKIVQDGADAVSAMSFQERAALFMEWTSSLPSVYRRRLIDQLISQNQRKLDDVAMKDGTQVQAKDGSTDVIN
jgi:hypothetical protein